MEIIVGAILAFLLFKSGVLSQFGVGSPAVPVSPAPVAVPVASSITPQSFQVDSAIVNSTVQGGTLAATSALTAAGASSDALKAIPVVGAAIGAIAGILIANSKQRAAEATNENSAVAKAVPGWDAAVSQIVAAFNNGSITAIGAAQLLTLALTNYWNEVTPQIQPGRNGCQGGAACPGITNNTTGSVTNEGGNNYCSGSIGAACCVGCADLNLSTSNMLWAVNQAQNSGKATTAFIQTVFASKYGGVNRAAYLVTFIPPASSVAA